MCYRVGTPSRFGGRSLSRSSMTDSAVSTRRCRIARDRDLRLDAGPDGRIDLWVAGRSPLLNAGAERRLERSRPGRGPLLSGWSVGGPTTSRALAAGRGRGLRQRDQDRQGAPGAWLCQAFGAPAGHRTRPAGHLRAQSRCIRCRDQMPHMGALGRDVVPGRRQGRADERRPAGDPPRPPCAFLGNPAIRADLIRPPKGGRPASPAEGLWRLF